MRRHLPRVPREDVSDALEAYLEGGNRPRFGVDATLTGRVLEIVLEFLPGVRYCCAVPSCHLGLGDDGFDRLRECLDGDGHDPPYPLTVRCRTLIRPGALFEGRSGANDRPDPMTWDCTEGD